MFPAPIQPTPPDTSCPQVPVVPPGQTAPPVPPTPPGPPVPPIQPFPPVPHVPQVPPAPPAPPVPPVPPMHDGPPVPPMPIDKPPVFPPSASPPTQLVPDSEFNSDGLQILSPDPLTDNSMTPTSTVGFIAPLPVHSEPPAPIGSIPLGVSDSPSSLAGLSSSGVSATSNSTYSASEILPNSFPSTQPHPVPTIAEAGVNSTGVVTDTGAPLPSVTTGNPEVPPATTKPVKGGIAGFFQKLFGK